MATLAETVTRILDDLSRPSDELGDIAKREILSAIGYYESSRFAFNERILNATLSATSEFAFSALVANDPEVEDIWAIDQVQVLYSTRLIEVDLIPWSQYFSLTTNLTTTANFPDFYSTFNRTMYVYPVLNVDIQSAIAAHVKLVTLDGITNIENAWLTEGEELIRSRACRMICQRKLDDYEKAQMFKQLEDEAYKGLVADAAVLRSTGILSCNE
jgi:hypothetical protein